MSSKPFPIAPGAIFLRGLVTQLRVIGALLMREIHTRYGRENVGYLWLIGEPLMLASVIGSLHSSAHTHYGNDMKPIPFSVLGYTIFIMFRGIVNRSEGGLEANAPLLYHKMVTIFDIVTARAVLEAAGSFLALTVLMLFLIGFDLADLPARPLYLIAAFVLIFFFAFGHSLVVTAITHENRTLGRLVHPYSYFMIPLSAAFYQVQWVPNPYRNYLLWLPLPHMFELARYGMFRSGDLRFFDGGYVVAACLVLNAAGLVLLRNVRSKVHLS